MLQAAYNPIPSATPFIASGLEMLSCIDGKRKQVYFISAVPASGNRIITGAS